MRVTSKIDRVARAICKFEGYLWPLDGIEPDAGDEEMANMFWEMAVVAVEAAEAE